jgi:hypothetical protein
VTPRIDAAMGAIFAAPVGPLEDRTEWYRENGQHVVGTVLGATVSLLVNGTERLEAQASSHEAALEALADLVASETIR